MAKTGESSAPTEFEALGKVLAALASLDAKQRVWVIASAVSNLGIAATLPTPTGTGGAGAGGIATSAAIIPGQPGSNAHARAFLRQKAPTNKVQQVACLAYYLTHFKEIPHFKTTDLSQMNTDAGGARIGNLTQAANNALHLSGYLAPAGGGRKQLSAYGEDVVNALPDPSAVKALEANKPRTRRAQRKAKAKKA